MKKAPRFLALLLAAALLLPFGLPARAEDSDIAIVYTNDVHCAVDENLGYASVAGLKKDLQTQLGSGNVLLADAGDWAQGGTLATLSQGADIVELMNAVGYDVVTIGNHEFDWKIPRLLELVKSLKATTVSCNFISLKTNEPVFEPYVIKTCGGKKVAFVGITTPESFTASTPGYFQDENGNYIYSLCEGTTNGDNTKLCAQVQKYVDAARKAGADYVIGLAHLGTEGVTEGLRSTDIIANTTGIDVLLDGHSHSVIASQFVQNKAGKNVLLSSTGTKLANIGKLTIKADGTITADLLSSGITKDASVETLAKQKVAGYDELTGTVIGKSDFEVPINNASGTRIVRRNNSALGDLDTDALRAVLGADIAMVNGGGLRAALPKGNITYGDVISVHPWGNTVCVAEVTGQQILDALEMGARIYPDENGGFLHVSGLRYKIDGGVASTVQLDSKGIFVSVAGARRVKDVFLEGADGSLTALDAGKTYTLAMNSYDLLYRGDGFSMFAGAKIVKDDGTLDCEVLEKYLKENCSGTVPASYAQAAGRITLITPAEAAFPDVKPGAWYEDGIQYVYGKGLMNGVGGSSFAPNGKITRAQAATFLYRLAGSPAVSGSVNFAFSDCADGTWYSSAVLWAAENRVITGSYGKYNPGGNITREDFAAVLYRYNTRVLKKEYTDTTSYLGGYSDAASVSEYAKDAMNWAVGAKLINGSDGALLPQGSATRAQAAAILQRFASAA